MKIIKQASLGIWEDYPIVTSRIRFYTSNDSNCSCDVQCICDSNCGCDSQCNCDTYCGLDGENDSLTCTGAVSH